MHHCWLSQDIYCNVGVPTLISIMIKKVNTCKFTYYDTWNYFSILLTEVPFLEKLFRKTQWCSNNVEFSTFLFGLTIFWSRWDKYWNNEHKISLGISKPNTFLWKEIFQMEYPWTKFKFLNPRNRNPQCFANARIMCEILSYLEINEDIAHQLW